ncbi:MAG: sensor histidine kinase [Nocardioidaceae bacterium]
MSERDPADYQPRLTWWGHLWRLLAATALGGVVWTELFVWQWQHDRAWFAIDLALGLVSLVVMHYRRRWPVQVVLLTVVLGFFSASSAGAATVALASLATRRRWREILPVTLASIVQASAFETYNPTSNDPFLLSSTATVLIIGVTVAFGMYIGSRRELLATLRERAESAEAEQALRIAQARTGERGRIAREMHDVLAHRISLVAMHAGALAYRTDLSPEEVRDASGVIQDNAHQALADLREVLGLLRDPTGDAPSRPQPTWCDLPALVEEAKAAGTNVVYTDEIAPKEGERDAGAGLPEHLGRTVYRIVQEGLTNARKHAPDTAVHVSVAGDRADGVLIEVRNPLRVGDRRTIAPPSGLGLVGLSERAALSGGTLQHEISDGHEFVLTARLPWAP